MIFALQALRYPSKHKLNTKLISALMMLIALVGCNSKKDSSKLVAIGDSIEKVSEKGPVKMTVRVSPREPRLSDIVDLEILVTAPQEIVVIPPAFGQAVGDFLVRDYGERKTDMFGQTIESNSRLFRYRLEPVHSGTHLIRSLAIEFTDNRGDSEAKGVTSRIESDPIELNITTELGDAIPDLANLEPMEAPRAIDRAFSWMWVIPVSFLISFFVTLLWVMRDKKGSIPTVPKRTPQEIANEQLQQLLSEQLPLKGLLKEFYLRLTGIVREYIEGTTGIHAPEQTTEEFLRDTRTTMFFYDEHSRRLKDFLEAADMVKYAGQQPDAEQTELSIVRAREFIDVRPLVPTEQSEANA